MTRETKARCLALITTVLLLAWIFGVVQVGLFLRPILEIRPTEVSPDVW